MELSNSLFGHAKSGKDGWSIAKTGENRRKPKESQVYLNY
jgi:hypothetical protein